MVEELMVTLLPMEVLSLIGSKGSLAWSQEPSTCSCLASNESSASEGSGCVAALDNLVWLASCLGHFILGKRALDNHWMVDWVCSRTGLGILEKRKASASQFINHPAPLPVTICITLSQLPISVMFILVLSSHLIQTILSYAVSSRQVSSPKLCIACISCLSHTKLILSLIWSSYLLENANV
jgi:hypothetical protein